MAITKLPLTKFVRASVIDAVNKINEIIDAVNKIVILSSALSKVQFDIYTSSGSDFAYIQWLDADNNRYRLQINLTASTNNVAFFTGASTGGFTRKFTLNQTNS